MKKTTFYLLLFGLGTILPYSAFVPWLLEYGPEPARFLQQAFDNRIGSFFTLDVICSAFTLIVAVISTL